MNATDSVIANGVVQALWKDMVIRSINLEVIDVSVMNGVVLLRGYTATPPVKKRAEDAARQVPGVRHVKNQLVTDNEVVTAVQQAFARDIRTRELNISMGSSQGVITLNGEVDHADLRLAAEEIAANVPLVRGVINYIQAPGVVIDPGQQRFLQPHVGMDVYARDLRLGKVAWVIFDPLYRRIYALVVDGSLPNPKRIKPGKGPDDMPYENRQVVIPITNVQDITAGGVWLSQSGVEAARLPDFNPDDYAPPNEGWPPPYPYSNLEVLFDIGQAPRANSTDTNTDWKEKQIMLLPIGAAIHCRDGPAGRLKYVVLDPETDRVTHLIVERGQLLRRDVVVPAEWGESTSEREVVLDATEAELNAQPEYDELDFVTPEVKHKPASGYRIENTRLWKKTSDSAGVGNIWTARFERYGVPDNHVLLERGLPVVSQDEQPVGKVDHLIVDPSTNRVVQFVVRKSGLLNRQERIVPVERCASVSEAGVRLDMTADEFGRLPLYQPPVGDEQISKELQQALDADPRTRDAGLRVDVQKGIVRLIGTMTEELKEVARAIARRIRGVTGFSDGPFAPPFPPLTIGEPVIARDTRYGRLLKVVIDPYARQVTHLIVRRDSDPDEELVIPIEKVSRVELEGIYLDVEESRLNDFPRYHAENFVQPLAGWEALDPYAAADTLFRISPIIGLAPSALPVVEHVVHVGVPENEIVMQRGAEVTYEGETVGTLAHMLIDPQSGTMTHLVVEGNEHGRQVIVPSQWIQNLYENRILLNHWEPEPTGVPTHENRSDDDLAADLTARIHAYPELNEVQVQVRNEIVRLLGTVQNDADKATAETIVRSVTDIAGILDELEIRQTT